MEREKEGEREKGEREEGNREREGGNKEKGERQKGKAEKERGGRRKGGEREGKEEKEKGEKRYNSLFNYHPHSGINSLKLDIKGDAYKKLNNFASNNRILIKRYILSSY